MDTPRSGSTPEHEFSNGPGFSWSLCRSQWTPCYGFQPYADIGAGDLLGGSVERHCGVRLRTRLKGGRWVTLNNCGHWSSLSGVHGSDVQESFRHVVSRQVGNRPPWGESSPIRRLATAFRAPSRVKYGHPVSGCAVRCVSCRYLVTIIQPVCAWCGKRQ